MKNTVFILPGFGLGCYPLQTLADALAEQGWATQFLPLPEHNQQDSYLQTLVQHHPITANIVVLGWSLGGQLASLLAERTQCRLITLASNPQFCSDASWAYGMQPEAFERFYAKQQTQPVQNLQQFAALTGLQDASPHTRAHIKHLKAQLANLSESEQTIHLLHLKWLRSLNTRAILENLPTPQCHIWGDVDTLISKHMAGALALPPQAHTHIITGASHLLPLTHSTECTNTITQWLNAQ